MEKNACEPNERWSTNESMGGKQLWKEKRQKSRKEKHNIEFCACASRSERIIYRTSEQQKRNSWRREFFFLNKKKCAFDKKNKRRIMCVRMFYAKFRSETHKHTLALVDINRRVLLHSLIVSVYVDFFADNAFNWHKMLDAPCLDAHNKQTIASKRKNEEGKNVLEIANRVKYATSLIYHFTGLWIEWISLCVSVYVCNMHGMPIRFFFTDEKTQAHIICNPFVYILP